ncbi:hypothetical protein FGO68_gene2936 [Halteria grandinella]|uniref:Response regulatory domain-containing protein n=1 Tax=Halteria grandinella TaxID=5974 RepID=A0A8J8NG35_HALGN|nr:hypothetical protein FGO68_gene2936 [Halteria grandinella]
MNCQEAKRLNEMLKDSKKLQKISKNSVGCGLGLCISNIIAKKMSGKKGIQFNSAQNEGSTFSFTIFDSQQLYNESQHCISQTFVKVLNQTYYFECPVSQPSVKQMGMSSKFNNTIFSQNSKISLEKGKYFSTEIGKRVSFTEQMDEFEMEDNVNLEIIIPRLSTNLKTEIVFYSISSKCCSRVLLVDDEIFNITTLQLILSKFHIIADKALNGQEALKKCQAKKASSCKQCLCSGYVAIFQISICQLWMDSRRQRNQNNGWFLDLLQKRFASPIQASLIWKTKQKAIAVGMDFYLTKPFEITLLEDYLRSRFPLGF